VKGTKRTWLYLLAALVLVLAIGCSNDASTDEENDDSEASDELEPVTFTYFSGQATNRERDTNDTYLGQYLEERTGVNFQLEYLTGDIDQRVGVMMASGDYPDVVDPDSKLDDLIDAGAFIPLNDLIEEHAPNLKALYEDYFPQMMREDGNIYHIPFGANQNEFIPNPDINQGAFWIQRAVLREFDYPELTTLDEYFDLIAQYKEMYPERDQGSTIGFTALTYDWRWFAFTNVPNHLEGYPNDGSVQINMDTLEASVYADNEATKAWLRKLNKINQEGLFD
jgi:putative aldouronate transport system substrate-binding protein